MARVILDAIAVAHLFEHLEVVGGALLQALGLQQAALAIEVIKPLAQFRADRLDRIGQPLLGRHKVLGRVDVDGLQALEDLASGGIHVANRLHLIAKQFDPHQPIFVGRADLEHIAAHPETAPGDLHVVAGVLVVHQLPQGTAQVEGFAHLKFHSGFEVFTGNPQAVNAADRGHHNHIAPLKQRAGRRVAQHVDLFVDRRCFGDVGVRDGHIRLGLVVVVIGDEVFNGVVREKFPQLIAELGRQRFVVGQHQGGPAGAGDHIGNREGFSGAGGPEKGLVALPRLQASHHLGDGGGLIPLGFVGGVELEGDHGTHCRGTMARSALRPRRFSRPHPGLRAGRAPRPPWPARR